MTTKSCVSLGFAGLAAAGLAFAASPADAAGQLSFERVDAVVGSPTNAIRASDLNADGRLDLVVSGGQHLFALTGRVDGRFATWHGLVDGLATGDFDGDGRIDFAVANDGRDYVSVLTDEVGCRPGRRLEGDARAVRRTPAPAASGSNAWPQGSWRSG